MQAKQIPVQLPIQMPIQMQTNGLAPTDWRRIQYFGTDGRSQQPPPLVAKFKPSLGVQIADFGCMHTARIP